MTDNAGKLTARKIQFDEGQSSESMRVVDAA